MVRKESSTRRRVGQSRRWWSERPERTRIDVEEEEENDDREEEDGDREA